jgi:hypothetical protein
MVTDFSYFRLGRRMVRRRLKGRREDWGWRRDYCGSGFCRRRGSMGMGFGEWKIGRFILGEGGGVGGLFVPH